MYSKPNTFTKENNLIPCEELLSCDGCYGRLNRDGEQCKKLPAGCSQDQIIWIRDTPEVRDIAQKAIQRKDEILTKDEDILTRGVTLMKDNTFKELVELLIEKNK